ncbi:LOW QUALITY PROTEIN: permease component of ribose/xylose/arabinose/galactoside ABC-type transporter [Saccharomonospora cyanea NA-134]|uniref:Autoinducer 2 import system permease protein LsrC n=1 Tax=Saccharomonospora cyanea NA-134 TaxID=882082 RepID=H5XMC2_9PSEU|nr:LOW QUALITY PROTEIN: permease component of ribose/xylose/arabinose/galactoside ABC-type transporter [Saccharomonospora cyanea NA-134]
MSRIREVLSGRELSIIGAFVAVVAVTTVVSPSFLSAQGVHDLFLNASIIGLLAIGQTLLVITRNIDLSVGSVMGLTAYLSGQLFLADQETPTLLVVLAGMALGAVCGAINGALVAVAKVPALVVTLGTLYVFRGLDHGWASATGVLQINADQMSPDFLAFGSGSVLGIPNLTLIMLVVLAVAGYALHNWRSGRELYAIGSNPDAARLAGIPAGKRVFSAFVISGALVGLAGVLHASYFGTINASVGTGEELSVVAAVVVGGVAIFGGSGTVLGAVLGALLLTTITSALPILGVPAFWQRAVDGAALLLAISLDRAVMVRLSERLRRERSERRA